MKARPTIFISGVSHEFSSFRDAVENEIEMKGCFAENQPGFAPDYRTVEEMLRRRLQDSDAVIHIVGFRFGAEPNARPAGAPRRSYTQMEFDIAREMQKPVYLFLSVDAAVRQPAKPEEQVEDAEATALQRAHRQAVQNTNYLYRFFKDQAELCRLVAEIPPVEAAEFKPDISHFDVSKYAPAVLIGREAETQLLNNTWLKVRRAESLRPHVLTFVALGGEGKTSLVAKWAADLAHQDWPGCDAVFAWSFYTQGMREQNAASSDLFLAEALTYFGDAAMAGSPAGAFDKGRRLAQLAGERRTLLILDGLEPLQYAPTSPTAGELKDQGIAALLKGLAANSHGLCIVTTRYVLPDLRAFLGKTVREEKLTRLSTDAGVALLQALGVKGSLRKTIPSADGRTMWNEYEKLVEDVKGHALTLNLLGSYLRDAHAGDIRQRDLIKLEEADAEEQGGHAFRVMDAYVQSFERGGKTAEDQEKGRRALALLQLLGLFDRPATADCLKALWQPPAIAGLTEPLIGISEAQRNLSLKRLEDAKLLTVNRAAGSGELIALDAHPLLREYFARRLRQQQPEAWRAAHRRLYEHLCATTPDKPDATLEDLQPLYQAVAHGCQAELFLESSWLYDFRIQRQHSNRSWRKLGAAGTDLGAITCFFERPWECLKPGIADFLQGGLMHNAAIYLFALGRLAEALIPMRIAIEDWLRKQDWGGNLVRFTTELVELELMLGEVDSAVIHAEQALTYTQRGNRDQFTYELARASQAVAFYQAGRFAEAVECFREAGQSKSWRNLFNPLLLDAYKTFQYYELVLAEVESVAWQLFMGLSLECKDEIVTSESHKVGIRHEALVALCRAVLDDVEQTHDWADDVSMGYALTDEALRHLTCGRAMLFLTLFGQSAFQSAQSEIDAALSSLRNASFQVHLPHVLLTRAWFRFRSGARIGSDSAQTDLDEAWEIAERGPMKLFLADIHLYRARLFFREPAYPWESPQDDLAAAEKLINDCGYHRRDEELADAKRAILGRELE